MAATDIFSQLRIPVSHCHFPGVGYGKSEGERGGGTKEDRGRPPLGREPRPLMHPSLGPPIDRPRHGPSSEIHNGQGRPRVAPQSCNGNSTSTSHHLSYLRFGSLLFAHHAYSFGSAVGADTGRKSWPNVLLNFSLIPNVFPVLPKLPLKLNSTGARLILQSGKGHAPRQCSLIVPASFT